MARGHERIAHRRTNCCHQESRRLVDQYGLIAVEDLSVNQMVHNHCLAKGILDAAWSQLTAFLSTKQHTLVGSMWPSILRIPRRIVASADTGSA